LNNHDSHLFEHGFIINECGDKAIVQMYLRRINSGHTWKKILTEKIHKDDIKKAVTNMRASGFNPINLIYQPFLNPHIDRH